MDDGSSRSCSELIAAVYAPTKESHETTCQFGALPRQPHGRTPTRRIPCAAAGDGGRDPCASQHGAGVCDAARARHRDDGAPIPQRQLRERVPVPADAGAVPGARVRAGHVQGGAAVHVGDHRAAVHLQRGDSRRDQFVLCAVPVLGRHVAHVERIPGRRDRILAGGSAQPQRPGEVRPVAAVPGDCCVLLLDDDRRPLGIL